LTVDGGANWTQQSNPEYTYLNGVHFSDSLTGIAVGYGIFRTTDGAASWTRDTTPSLYFQDVCLLDGGVALAVASGGAIVRAGPDGSTGIVELPPPPMFGLRIHPNPFNPSTTISFTLEREGPVVVDVFDLTGRRIRRLADGRYPVGDYALEWDGCHDDGRSAPSGSYMLRIMTEYGRRSQGVVLIR
jgi:hypothetical protein